MEIISYVLEGQLEHKDSMGTGATCGRARSSACRPGPGCATASSILRASEPLHFLQNLDRARDARDAGRATSRRRSPSSERRGRLRLVGVARRGRGGGDGQPGRAPLRRAVRRRARGRASSWRPAGTPGCTSPAAASTSTARSCRPATRRRSAGPGTLVLSGQAGEPGEVLLFDLA